MRFEKEEEHVETCENQRIMGWHTLKHFKFAGKLMNKWKHLGMAGLGGDDFGDNFLIFFFDNFLMIF